MAEVREPCGSSTTTAARLRSVREAGSVYPPDGLAAGVRAWAAGEGRDQEQTRVGVQRYLPRDRELLTRPPTSPRGCVARSADPPV